MGPLDDALTKRGKRHQRPAGMASLNRIREANGQEPCIDRLHTLLDALDTMPDSIPEVRTPITSLRPRLPTSRPTNRTSSPLSSRERSGSTPTPSRWPRNSRSRLQVATKLDRGGPEGVAAEGDDVDRRPSQNARKPPARQMERQTPARRPAAALPPPDPTVAETVAVGITERVQPDEVTGHDADATVQEAEQRPSAKPCHDVRCGLMEFDERVLLLPRIGRLITAQSWTSTSMLSALTSRTGDDHDWGSLKPLLHEQGESNDDQPDDQQGDPDDDPPGTGGAAGSEADSDDDQRTEGVEQTETPRRGERPARHGPIRRVRPAGTAGTAGKRPARRPQRQQPKRGTAGRTDQPDDQRPRGACGPPRGWYLLLGLLLVALSGGDDQPTEVDSEVTEETEQADPVADDPEAMSMVEPIRSTRPSGERRGRDRGRRARHRPRREADISLDELDVDPDDVEEEAGAASADESDPDDQTIRTSRGPTRRPASRPCTTARQGRPVRFDAGAPARRNCGVDRRRAGQDRRGHRGLARAPPVELDEIVDEWLQQAGMGADVPPGKASPSARPVSSRWSCDRDRRSERPDGWTSAN